jgi:hypothetical protein
MQCFAFLLVGYVTVIGGGYNATPIQKILRKFVKLK